MIVSGVGAPAGAPAQPRVFPLRVRNPAGYARAKRAAASLAGTSSAPTSPGPPPTESPSSPQTALFGTLSAPGLSASQQISAFGEDADLTPPDTTGAIGPADYVEIVNAEIAVYDSANLTPVGSPVDLATFTGGSGPCDVQVKYDPGSDRWFFLALRCDGTTTDNQLYVGWSKTDDPSDLATGWCTFAVSSSPATSLDDYPKLGLDGTHVIVGTNDYDASSSAFQTAHILVAPKPASGPLGSCTAPSFTVFGSPGAPLTTADGNFVFTPQPATVSDASSTLGYVVAADFEDAAGDQSGSHLMIWQIGGTSTTPTLLNVGDVAVSSFAVPPPVPQPGSTDTIDSLDGRLTQAVAAADPNLAGAEAVWTQHTISDGDGGSVVRWYEVVPATMTLVQSGNIGDRGGFVFNGAIAPTRNGGAVIDYNAGGPDRLVEVKAQSRLGTDALGTMSGPVSLATSSAVDSDFSCPSQPFGASAGEGVCRWGDYAGASVDPTNPGVVWGSNQVNGQTGAFINRFGHQSQWATENFALTPTVTPAPTASFSATPNPVPPGSPASFDGGGSSDPSDIIDYRWSFGDGTSADTRVTSTVVHAYGAPGTYSVQLTVSHSGGRTANTTQSVIVDQPSATFTVSPNPTIPGATVAFDGTASGDAAGTIAAYTWSFGDGAGASGPTASHSFAGPGSYLATLTVTNNHGQTAATTRVVTVNAPPAPAFTIAPNPARAGAAVSFDATGSTHPPGLSAAYTWSFGDGGTAGGPIVSHTYTKPGSYGVTLIVVDGDGQSATTLEHVLVRPPPLRGHLAIRGHPSISAIRKHGLALTLSSTETGRATFNLTARIPPKRRGGKATIVTLVRGRIIAVGSGSHGVTLRLSRAASRALGGARSVSVKVTVTDSFAQKLTLFATHPL